MRKSELIYLFLVFIILSLIYSTDFFQMPPGHQSVIYFGGTEDYILYRIRNTELNFIEDIQTYSGFNYGVPVEPPEFTVYRSQTGFYGSILKYIQSLFSFPPEAFLRGTRIVFSAILAAILAGLALSIQKIYGWIASLIFAVLCACTYWLIGPSKHLIWFYFILFLPFVYSIYVYPRVVEGKLSLRKFLLGLFIIFILEFLRGYTYITCLSLSAAIPVVYHRLKHKDFKQLLSEGLLIGLVSFLAYVLVLGIHYLQLRHSFGNHPEAINFLLDKALFRIQGESAGSISLRDLFLGWARIPFFYLPSQLTDRIPQVVKNLLPLNMIRTLYFMFGLNLTVTLLFSFRFKKNESIEESWQTRLEELVVIAFTCAASLLASWSWFPAKGHMIAHPHMNGIMFVIPFALTLYFYTGVLVQFLVAWHSQRIQ